MVDSPVPADQRSPSWAEAQLTEPFYPLVDKTFESSDVASATQDPALEETDLWIAIAAEKDRLLLDNNEVGVLANLAARATPVPPPRARRPIETPSPPGLRHSIAAWVRGLLRWTPANATGAAAPTPTTVSESSPVDAALRSEITATRQSYTETVSQSIGRLLRSLIADATEQSYSTTLTLDSAPGLAELVRDDIDVRGARSESLERMMRSMNGGSIGISGPRGVGKTTILEAFRLTRTAIRGDVDKAPLSVLVSAPVVYEGRDFVLHLFGRLCDRVLELAAVQGAEDGPSDRQRPLNSSMLIATAVLVTIFVAGALLLVALLETGQPRQEQLAAGAATLAAGLALMVPYSLLSPKLTPFPVRVGTRRGSARRATFREELELQLPWALGLAETLTGATLVVLAATGNFPSGLLLWAPVSLLVGLVLGVTVRSAARSAGEADYYHRYGYGVDPLVPVAELWNERIRFQQRYTTGWSGGLKLPVGEAWRNVSRDATEQQLSLPGAVDALRRFIVRAAVDRDVIIAIDELDKLESGKAATSFLNQVKAIFGIEGCFYLVSVSEDAMSQFERRGTSVRDVFDSSFDEVFHLDYLKIHESRTLLNQRVIRLPVPFLFLSHIFSAGLPRDLIRATRTVFDLRIRLDRPIRLSEACAELVRDELIRKTRAATTVARAISLEPHASNFLRWLGNLSSPTFANADALLSCCRALGTVATEELPQVPSGSEEEQRSRERLIDLLVEVGLVAYFAATALEFFRDDLTPNQLRAAEHVAADGTQIDLLARARQTFGVNRRIAWSTVTQFRDRINHSLPAVADGSVEFPLP